MHEAYSILVGLSSACLVRDRCWCGCLVYRHIQDHVCKVFAQLSFHIVRRDRLNLVDLDKSEVARKNQTQFHTCLKTISSLRTVEGVFAVAGVDANEIALAGVQVLPNGDGEDES